MDWLKGKKTYIVAILMVLVSVVKLLTGDMNVVEFFSSEYLLFLISGLGLGSLRAGIAKK